jgi:secreted Zn-dependent insulinase-like peptidase
MSTKEFPTYEEFTKWLQISGYGGMNAHAATEIHNYFHDRVRTVMPEAVQSFGDTANRLIKLHLNEEDKL